MLKKLTTEQFIAKARNVHGDKYDYSLVEYKNSQTKVTIICPEHGAFTQIPNDHLRGCVCAKCACKGQSNTGEFIEKAKKLHGNKYDYSAVNYVSAQIKVNIACPIHGTFQQTPNSHLNGNGCAKCAGIGQSSTEEFIAKAHKVHGDKYDYSLVEYIRSDMNVTVVCPEHGTFTQKASKHLCGTGCPACAKSGYSRKSLRWLRQISDEHRVSIQHAENDGEFRIPGTRIRVDGYCKETNTIYEFHGDAYHGNPQRYQAVNKCHPFDRQITAGELYQKTLDREEKIRSLGYNLVVMWESEFDSRK